MELIAIGANYKGCPPEVREALLREWTTPKLLQLKPLLQEAAVLDTCHRVEVYGVVPQPESAEAALVLLGARREGISHYQGEAVVRHLFRVSAGLDSLIPGESQVLGQVRQAADRARHEGLPGPVLSTLFRQAITGGKQVRAQVQLAGRWASLGTAAAELAHQALGGLKGKNALLLGAGKTTELATIALRQRGISKLWLSSRTQSRAEVAAQNLGAYPIPIENMAQVLSQCHLLISATTAPHPIVSRAIVETAMQGRDFPLHIIDLALPRDVEPEVGQIPGVFLWNVDQLPNPALESPSKEDMVKAEALIEQGVEQFNRWFYQRQAIGEIIALYHKAEKIRLREVRKVLPSLGTLSPEQQATVHAMTKAIVKKLLHQPVAHYKAEVGQGNGALTRKLMAELFDLNNGGRESG